MLKPELNIQKLLREHGLDHVKNLLNLEVKEKDNLILLKYNQTEADWSQPALHECRGIILDKNNWDVVVYGYRKFFNLQEGYAAVIDWNSAKCLEKKDGSLINLAFVNGEWLINTSGNIGGDNKVGIYDDTFKSLFIRAVKEQYNKTFNEFTNLLNKNYTYMFELTTEQNIIITQTEGYSIWLHGIRDMNTLQELSIDDIDFLEKVKQIDLKNVEEINKSFETMTFQEEGYVVVDKNFNRIKIKNPKYVACHHTAFSLSPYHVVDIVKKNELDEFLSYFPNKRKELEDLQTKYNYLVNKLQKIFDNELKYYTDKDKKTYALKIFETCEYYGIKQFSHVYFNLLKGISIKDTLNKYSDKDLFHVINENYVVERTLTEFEIKVLKDTMIRTSKTEPTLPNRK